LRGAFDFLKYFAFREGVARHIAHQRYRSLYCLARSRLIVAIISSDVFVCPVSILKMAENLAISGAL
jgi:hypothetical protein